MSFINDRKALSKEIVGQGKELDLSEAAIKENPKKVLETLMPILVSLFQSQMATAWFSIMRIIEQIVGSPELLFLSGYVSEKDFLTRGIEELGGSQEDIKEANERYCLYKNNQCAFHTHGLCPNDPESVIYKPGMYEKLGLFDIATKVKRRELGRDYSEFDVFNHLINDDLRAFQDYINPAFRDQVRMRNQIKRLSSNIREKAKGAEQVHLISLPSHDPVLISKVRNIINEVQKEAIHG